MKDRCVRILPYIYFLRFSLLLWLLPLLLLILDASMTRLFTRGIFLPDFAPQYLCNTFFLCSTGMVALVTARLVCYNGEDRFEIKPPDFLDRFLGNRAAPTSWLPLLVCQMPTAVALIWIAVLANQQEIPCSRVLLGIALGYLLAFIFWISVNAFYFWSYNPAPYARLNKGFLSSPRIVLFPSSWFGLSSLAAASGPDKRNLSKRAVSRIFDLFARLGPGYSCQMPLPDGLKRWPLWEGQCFALVGFTGLLLLYLLLFPLTAPLRLIGFSIGALFVASLLAFVLGFIALSGGAAHSRSVSVFRIVTPVLVAIFIISIWLLYFYDDPQRFPVLSSVLVLLTLLIWAASAIGFFLDRYRIPLATVMTLYFLFGSSLFHAGTYVANKLNRDVTFYDHYFTVMEAKEPVTPPSPADIFKAKRQQYPNDPLIVITATGGGLHAAGWTASVLAELEKASDKLDHYSWHDHILLLSTVSGGSVGAYAYLRELSLGDNFGDHRDLSLARMTDLSTCSSLEAVGWGLTYVDAVQALTGLPLLRGDDPNPGRPGDDPALKPRIFGDRSWALGAAFARNLKDYGYCMLDDSMYRASALSAVEVPHPPPYLKAPEELTLRVTLDRKLFPAFTMNTTAVESGERFLLANYKIPADTPESASDLFIPAESFLNVYGDLKGKDESHIYTDLPLSAAARLSATFPYVSSVSRIPPGFTRFAIQKDRPYINPGFHFADGGYYDNDGVASAIEFLCYALANGRCDPPKQEAQAPTIFKSQVTNHYPPSKHTASPSGPSVSKTSSAARRKSSDSKPNILFVEIRDSCDVTHDNPNGLEAQQRNSTALYDSFNELSAPLHAFWLAGHDSVTLRNRRELQVAESALGMDDQHLKHIVVPYCERRGRESSESNYTLSWSLTPRQRREIQCIAQHRAADKHDCWKDNQPSHNTNKEHYAGDAIDSAIDWIKAVRLAAVASTIGAGTDFRQGVRGH